KGRKPSGRLAQPPPFDTSYGLPSTSLWPVKFVLSQKQTWSAGHDATEALALTAPVAPTSTLAAGRTPLGGRASPRPLIPSAFSRARIASMTLPGSTL